MRARCGTKAVGIIVKFGWFGEFRSCFAAGCVCLSEQKKLFSCAVFVLTETGRAFFNKYSQAEGHEQQRHFFLSPFARN